MSHGFIIAAASSGAGKTTLSLGIMRALSRRRLAVQPFKCGPDYIDTKFHSAATGNVSVNLDTFLSSEGHVCDLFHHYSSGNDVAIVEGVMGMFDGFSKSKGSSADIARLLNLQIVLLVNAASTAYSVAPLIYGFKNFMPEIKIAGVIFNRVASPSHFAFLKEACYDAGVRCFGCLMRDNSLIVPSRHLGLTLSAKEDMERFINNAADSVEATIDLDSILSATHTDLSFPESLSFAAMPPGENALTVAVAHDEAFNFIYPANIDRLRAEGCSIIEFSPLHDKKIPHEAGFVYLPGGYPELFADRLSANHHMMESVREYVARGGKMWAECGGMIYLCKDIDGLPLCGVFPFGCTMEDSKLTLGYRKVDFGDTIFYGHEFHYSRLSNPDVSNSEAVQFSAAGKKVTTPVYRHNNVLASYTHLYWGETGINNLLRMI